MSYQLGQIDSDERDELFTEPRDREPRSRFRGLLAAAATLLVIGVFAGGLWFAYHQGLRQGSINSSGEVPLIRADERPTKVKPENPGGMEVPDRDKLIYTQKRAAVEHLLPPPEKPMPRPTPPATSTPQAEKTQAPAPPASLGAPSSAPALVPPAQPQQPATKPADKSKPQATVPAKVTTAPVAPSQTGGVRMQVGSLRSEEAARREWERIRRGNSDLLGNLAATPIRADLGEKGVFYRIQTGPISDAERICSELKRRNIGCIIAR